MSDFLNLKNEIIILDKISSCRSFIYLNYRNSDDDSLLEYYINEEIKILKKRILENRNFSETEKANLLGQYHLIKKSRCPYESFLFDQMGFSLLVFNSVVDGFKVDDLPLNLKIDDVIYSLRYLSSHIIN